MRKLFLIFLVFALSVSIAFAQLPPEHGGGNGGDDFELELKKKSLQIGYFLKSDIGSKVFKVLSADAILEAIEKTDIDVISGNVIDKYGTIRTCINESDRSLITCNLDRLQNLKKNNKNDILTAVLFHEILGIMGLELGYQENVSMYPISSKILPYESIISSTPLSESEIRPEYFGLDNRSYGLTLVNKSTHESIRMICLNSNVEIHRCRNFSIVRNSNGLQAPMVPSIVSISPAELSKISIEKLKTQDLVNAEKEMAKLQANGFKYISINWKACDGYRYGAGFSQKLYSCDLSRMGLFDFILIGVPDTALEVGKQTVNLTFWPIKAAVNLVRATRTKGELKKLNKKMTLVKSVLNLNNDLSIVGKTKMVSDSDYNFAINVVTNALLRN